MEKRSKKTQQHPKVINLKKDVNDNRQHDWSLTLSSCKYLLKVKESWTKSEIIGFVSLINYMEVKF